MIDMFWDWCKQSATLLYARLMALVGGLITIVGFVPEVFDTPGLKEAMLDAGIDPKWVKYLGLLVIFMNAGTEVARRRTLPKDPPK